MKALLAASLALMVAHAAWGADAALPSEGRVLVLRSGQVLHGEAVLVGDRYTVRWGADEIRVAAADVDWCGSSLDEAYHAKRDRLAPDDLRARLLLAEWCLRVGLPDRAADQSLAMLLLAPHDRRVQSFERRLLMTAHEQATDARRESERPVATAVADPPSRLASDALHRLPPGAVEMFTNQVQPLLNNRCATNSCHGYLGAQEFKIMRPALGGITSQRATQRNMQATLAMIDQAAPEQSRLLAAARSPHGGASRAPLDAHVPAQYEALRRWVLLAASSTGGKTNRPADAPPPATIHEPNAGLLQPANRLPTANAFAPVERTTVGPPPATSPPPDTPPPDTTSVGDPFDPEIFHRRYAPPP